MQKRELGFKSLALSGNLVGFADFPAGFDSRCSGHGRRIAGVTVGSRMLSILSNLGAESQERPMAGDRSMSGPEDDIAQAEKRRIIREQATTFHQHAQSAANDEAGGRFAT